MLQVPVDGVPAVHDTHRARRGGHRDARGAGAQHVVRRRVTGYVGGRRAGPRNLTSSRRSRGHVSSPRRLVVDLAATAPSWALPSWAEAAILSAAPADWDVHFVRDLSVSDGDGTGAVSAEALGAVVDAEVYFGHGLAPTLFAAAPRLRWVQTAAAGVASLLFPAMRDSDVRLTNSAGVMGDTIAEHVLGGVIYLLRSFDIAV